MAVVVKDGKFYRDGVEEPAKFGDKDQIEALKKANKIKEAPTAKLVNHETVTYTAVVCFTCPECMHENRDEWDTQEDFEFDEEDLDGENLTCCRCKHVFEIENDNGTLKLTT
jgi:hypothetical protein